MKYYEFSLVKPLKYNLTGKFQAPSPEWLHFTRYMQDYELIVVTEGVAYLQVEHQLYSIGKGEFLIFPPSAKQAGYKKSSCAFYEATEKLKDITILDISVYFCRSFMSKKSVQDH